ncbi:MAG: hypothetical protein V1919_00780 [Candidatus Omnitrophota bacterium]
MGKSGKKLGEILVGKGIITSSQLNDALVEQRLTSKFLGIILKERGLITSKQFMEALSEQFGMVMVDLKTEHIDMELARKYSNSLIVERKCFPFFQDEYTVTVAIFNPLDVEAIGKIEEESKPRKVNLVLADEADLDGLIKNFRLYINQDIQRLLRRKPLEGK